MLLIHAADDRRSAADGLVAHTDRLRGLDIGKAVMVDDLEYLGLLKACDSLRFLVVVNEHYALSARAQQVVSRQCADDLFVLVEHGIAAIAAFEHLLAHIVYVIIQMEAYRIVGMAGARYGYGLIDELCNARRVKGRGYDAGFSRMLEPLLFSLRLAQDDAVYAELQRTLDHIRLIAAQHDAVGIVKKQRFAALRQRNGDVSGYAVEQLRVLVEYLALQHAEDIAQRNIVNVRVYYRQQAVRCDIACRERSVKRAVLVYDGDHRYLLLAHHVPCSAHSDR